MHTSHRASASPSLGLLAATLILGSVEAQCTRYLQSVAVAVANVARESSGSVIGVTANGTSPFTTSRWNGSAWVALTSSGPTSRAFPSMTGAPGGVVLFGGQNTPLPNNNTWLWNGTSWSTVAVTTSPSQRNGAAAAQMPGGGNAVIFGGQDALGAFQGDTWMFNGLNWQQVIGTGPSARFGAAMAQDGAAGLLLFGGVDASGFLADTWQFNGTTWTQLFPATTPAVRMLAAMVADPQPTLPFGMPRKFVVLSGGVNSNSPLADVWAFEFGDWVLQPQVATTSSGVLSAAFDSIHREGVFVEDPTTPLAGAFVVGQFCHTQYGFSCACAGGAPILVGGSATPQIGNTTAFNILAGTPNGGMFLVLGFTPASVPINAACNIWVSAGGSSLFVGLDATGGASVPLAIPNAVGFIGLTLYAQSLDLVGMCVSNGLETRIGR